MSRSTISFTLSSRFNDDFFGLMSRVTAVELDHCKELAMQPGSLFEFTGRFIPAARRDQLLALYALTQSLGSIPLATADDTVKWTKLKWWREELAAEPGLPSRHPILRALWQSGARENLPDDLLLTLVDSAMMLVDAPPDADEEAMFERLAAQGTTGILLELALDGDKIDAQELAMLGAASELFNMISGFIAHGRTARLRLPLNLLAKYQLRQAQLEQQQPGAELVAAVSQLVDKGIAWFAQGSTGLDVSGADLTGTHLQLRWAMEARLLARHHNRAGVHPGAGKRFGPSDAWFAWQFCRNRRI